MLIERITQETGLATLTVSAIAATAPHRYKVYTVKKKDGKGQRVIAQPAKEVKALQRFIVREVINGLPVHEAATAYRRDRNIRHNALVHVDKAFLLKMDFVDFFPSLRPHHFRQHIERYLACEVETDDIELISRLCFWRPRGERDLRLAIGAPSSPFISNTLMYDFDTQMTDFAKDNGVSYTRYADDLTFSTNQKDVLRMVEKLVSDIVRTLPYPAVAVNVKKTVHTSKKRRRQVTGLVLSSQGEISLGRERKRNIRAMMHRAVIGTLLPEQRSYLKGLLAFSSDVEPGFVARLKKKYGGDEVSKILKEG